MLFEVLGWIGMLTFVLAYCGISLGTLKADGRLYQGMNFGGALAVGASVYVKQAWPAFALEVVWGCIAGVSLIRTLQRKGTC